MPQKTRAAEFEPFEQLPYTPATPALSWRRRRGRWRGEGGQKTLFRQNPLRPTTESPRALRRGRRGGDTGGAAGPPSNLREKTPSAHLERVFWIDLAP